MTIARTMSLGAALALGVALCAGAARAMEFTPAEKAAIAALPPAHGHALRLDMSNPSNRVAILALWRASGISREKDPKRFEALDKMGASRAAVANMPLNLPLGFSGSSWTNVSVSGMVAAGEVTSYTQITLTLMKPDMSPIAAASADEEDKGAPLLLSTPPGDNADGGALTAISTLYITYRDGTPLIEYEDITGTELPSAVANDAPVMSAAPNVVERVLVCTDNTITGCDYTFSQTGTAKIELPLKGSVTLPTPIDARSGKPTGAAAALYVLNTAGAAACTLADGQSFLGDRNTKVSGATLSWNFSRADFGSECYSANATYDLVLSLKLMTGGKPVHAAIASSLATPPGVGVLGIAPFQMLKASGGVAAKAAVTMADGTTKPLDQIVVGDKVLDGTAAASVYAISSGTMSQSNTLSAGGQVSVTTTFTQAVSTGKGAVQAQNVTLDDSVTTQAGSQQIVERSQKRLSKEAKVNNLFLTTQGGYFAGGIRVLDATAP
jgi:hypothetical protein